MIDLNSQEFAGQNVEIFNNGNAGFVENVEISVHKKNNEDHEKAPDYSIIAKDSFGEVKQGFYYKPAGSETMSEEALKKAQSLTVRRMKEIADTMVPEGFEYPKVKTYEEAMDAMASIINTHAKEQLFGVFVNYGTKSYPRKYLEIRFFNAIVNMKSGKKLFAGAQDQMERIDPDGASSSETASNDWATGWASE